MIRQNLTFAATGDGSSDPVRSGIGQEFFFSERVLLTRPLKCVPTEISELVAAP